MQKPRCLIIFEESIKSEETKKVYSYSLEKFRKWANMSYTELLQADEKSIQTLLEDYIIFLKGKISPNSINTQTAPVFLFYQMNDVNLNKIRLKKMFPSVVKRSGYNAYSRDDIEKMLASTKSKRTKACIMILSSTGCRSGALIDLKLKDVENYKDGCKLITFYRDDVAEYYGFLTSESSRSLDDYLEQRIQDNERLTPESPLIRERYTLASVPPRKITRQMLESMIETSQKDVKRTKDSTGRHNIQITNGFRKFFNSVLKIRPNANLSLCEKLMGHSVTVGLDNYYLKASKQALFEEFSKASSELIISEAERREKIIERQNLKISELEAKDQEIEKLKIKFEAIEHLIKRSNLR